MLRYLFVAVPIIIISIPIVEFVARVAGQLQGALA